MYNDMKTAEDRLRKSNEPDWAYLPMIFGVGAAVAVLIISLTVGHDKFIEDVATFIFNVRN